MSNNKEIKLYNGKITINFTEASHRYIIKETGERPISVTGCTSVIDKSRQLIFWATGLAKEHLLNLCGGKITAEDIETACNLHAVKKKEAANIGTLVHEWCSKYIESSLEDKKILEFPEEEKVLNGVLGFLKWKEENKVKFLASEQIVYSLKNKFVGIADAIAVIDKKLTLVDFKTSKSPHYPEYKFQVAAYRGAYEEESGKKIEKSIIVHFGKDTGEFAVVECPDHKKEYATFLACLTIKKTLKEYE